MNKQLRKPENPRVTKFDFFLLAKAMRSPVRDVVHVLSDLTLLNDSWTRRGQVSKPLIRGRKKVYTHGNEGSQPPSVQIHTSTNCLKLDQPNCRAQNSGPGLPGGFYYCNINRYDKIIYDSTYAVTKVYLM